MNDKKKESGGFGTALGLCMGLAIGTAVGAATGNLGLWMPIVMCLGLALGHGWKTDSENEEKSDDTERKE